MLKYETKDILLYYINRLINLGIPQNSIYYSNSTEINLFIFPKSLLTEKIYNGMASLIKDSFKYYDTENDIPFMNILPMLDKYIEKAKYPLASDILNESSIYSN